MPPAPSNPTRRSLRERSPTAELLFIAAPTIITMVSYPMKQFVDAWMVSMLGQNQLAAQGNGSIAAFLPISFFFGLASVVNTFVAQHLGAGRPERGPAYAWNALWLGAFGWIAMLVFAAFIGPIFRTLGHDPMIERLETDYSRILLAGAIFTVGARTMSYFFYGVHRPMIVMAATIIGNLVNLGLDYILIFGKFGAPALGVHGAALATVFGGLIEFAIPMALFLGPTFHRAYRTRSAWRFSPYHVKSLLRLGWAGAVQWVNELGCWAVFMTVLVGRFGPAENAAGWVALRYMQLSFMPAVGMSIAVTAVVGRRIGMGDLAGAERRAWLGMRLAMMYMGALAVGFVIFRDQAVRLFISEQTPPEQIDTMLIVGRRVMIVAAVFQVFDAMAIVLMGGLRGAGDTIWPGVVSAIEAWGLIVVGGLLAAELAPQWGSLGPWIAAGVYIIAMGLTMLFRFTLGPWRSIRLFEDAPPPISAPSL